MSIFSTAFNMLRTTVGPTVERIAQSRAAVAATSMARSEWGAAKGFYSAAPMRGPLKGLGALGAYVGSSPYRALGVSATSVFGSIALARHGRKSWGLWGGPLGSAASHIVPSHKR